ncbi:MAG: anthranilate phosphoribosyltransferase [Planctomycetota bacterium]
MNKTHATPENASERAHRAISELIQRRPLGANTTESLFDDLLSGRLDDAQIGAVLALIQAKGVDADELLGAARVMRRHVTTVPFQPNDSEALIDTCGTGGAAKTFNISTAAALVAASVTPPTASGLSRVVVAKHGNRSRTGRGSAEALAALGVNIDATPNVQALCLREVGVCFCFAIRHHPAMKHAAGPRASLGSPTVFNLLGPLTNPAGAGRQVIGVYRPEFVGLVAHALAGLGATSALVAHSDDGMDELSTAAINRVAWVRDGQVHEETVDGRSFGLEAARPEDLRASDLKHAASLVKASLDGSSTTHRDVVVLNAAAALVVAGAVSHLDEGVELAKEAIKSGKAYRLLERLAVVSQGGGG